MSKILNGVPEPRFVLLNDLGGTVDDFTLEEFADMRLTFVPDFLRHELRTGEVKSKLRGFRLKCAIEYEHVTGDELKKLRKLLDRRAFVEARFYPWSSGKPLYWERITIDDSDIQLAYFYLLAQREFTLNIISHRLLDYVPLEDAAFLSWGNIVLQFSDLEMAFSTLG